MRTGCRSDRGIVSKTLEEARGVAVFAVICSHPPPELQSMHSALRSRDLGVDHDEIKRGSKSTGDGMFLIDANDQELFMLTTRQTTPRTWHIKHSLLTVDFGFHVMTVIADRTLEDLYVVKMVNVEITKGQVGKSIFLVTEFRDV